MNELDYYVIRYIWMNTESLRHKFNNRQSAERMNELIWWISTIKSLTAEYLRCLRVLIEPIIRSQHRKTKTCQILLGCSFSLFVYAFLSSLWTSSIQSSSSSSLFACSRLGWWYRISVVPLKKKEEKNLQIQSVNIIQHSQESFVVIDFFVCLLHFVISIRVRDDSSMAVQCCLFEYLSKMNSTKRYFIFGTISIMAR